MLLKKILLGLSLLLCFAHCEFAGAQTTKLVVAYASPAATFCPGWIAKKEGIFAKYGLDVEMVLMQGASVYMPALASGNIQVLYGGGTAVSRAIATGGFDLTVIATETRYVPLRLLCGCQVANTRVLFFLVTLSLPDQRETCCYTWHGTGPSHFFAMRSL
jgi:ABC-type nitrate/sulfonate/bicarbonate transport system substrate-binding protein